MCAVAGIHAYHPVALPVDRGELAAIRDQMAARGPDGSGEWFGDDGRIGLAHRRLSIIDLSDRAAQPMASADGRLVISFNGEIYNHAELRRGLEARGHVFRTTSDTEVLLQLYAEKGEAMLGELRGMFAFALWDARRGALLLARDPYGIKPLYYADDGWTLRLASQVKALLASPRVSRAPEPAGLAGFYLFGSVPEPYTLYQEIRSLPAGSFLWVDSLGPGAARPYFRLGEAWADAEAAPAPSQPRTAFSEAVRDSVRHHMVADVPVGAFLSAGIDSGALVGLMRDVHAGEISTVTLAFDEFRGSAQDESPLAEEMARLYGTRHRTRVVGEAEFRADLPRILEAMDQPSIDGINTWFVSKAAREQGLKVAVSGLGGDELLGGYPSFRSLPAWVRAMWLPAHLPGVGVLAEQVQAAFGPLVPRLNPKAASLLRYGGSYAGAWLARRGLFMPHELPAVLGEERARAGLQRLQPLAHLSAQLRPGPRSPFARVAVLEAAFYMRNQLLRDTDWAGMAHALEVRTPLVDAMLLRQAAPLVLRAHGQAKDWLARSPATPLPATVAQRAKTGFVTPVAQWQKRLGDNGAAPAASGAREPWARSWACRLARTRTEASLAVA
jgi:asparagine synthase (glutamine-hydrolysing)